MLAVANKLKALNLLTIRRATRGARGKAGRLRKPPRMLYPASAERTYRKELRIIVAALGQVVDTRLIPQLERILAQAQATRPSADNADVRLDDYSDAVRHLLELMRSEFFGRYDATTTADLVRRIGAAAAAKNGAEVGKVFSEVLGVDLIQSEPWLGPELKAFTVQNVALIKSLSTSYFDRVEQLVFQGAGAGRRWQDVRSDLRDQLGVSRRKGELIARDQVGKLNGQLSELRQTQAGVERYTWRTSRDERVRATHRHLEGKICSWAEPPNVGGRRLHPGQDYQCRCYAEPVLDDLIGGDE